MTLSILGQVMQPQRLGNMQKKLMLILTALLFLCIVSLMSGIKVSRSDRLHEASLEFVQAASGGG